MASRASTKETLSSSGHAEEPQLGHPGLEHRHHRGEHCELRAVDQAREEQAARAQARGHAPRHEEVGEQGEEDQQLERGRPFDQGEVASRVLQHHGLVDHGQLEMRGRIVHRQPPRLGQRHDEERGEGQEVARAHRLGGPIQGPRHDLAEVGGPGSQREGEHRHRDGGLGERGHRHLPARSHASERGARVEPGEREEEGPEQQQVHHHQEIADPVEGQRHRQDGQEHVTASVLVKTT